MAETITPNTVLHTHAGARLSPPDHRQLDGLWSVTLLMSNLTVKVSPAAAFLLVGFMGGQSIERVLSDVNRCGVGDPESAMQAIGWLRETGFLVDSSDTGHQWAEHILKTWSRYEWNATVDYHVSTFDFPFVDYSQPGSVEFDAHLMDHYGFAEPDPAGTKRYSEVSLRIGADSTKQVLQRLNQSFASAWQRFCNPGDSSNRATIKGNHLLDILSTTFGHLRNRTVLRNGSKKQLIRKTSPSGGSRHPTEAYVAVLEVEDVPAGLYHFCVETNSLDRINDLPPPEQLEVIFEGPFRSRQETGTEPAAIVVMTSVFDRVMWRYREPRTFRTLFMDVGHLTTTLQFTSSLYGYTCYSQHGLIDDEIEHLIRADRLTEGVIYGAAIGVPGTFPKP